MKHLVWPAITAVALVALANSTPFRHASSHQQAVAVVLVGLVGVGIAAAAAIFRRARRRPPASEPRSAFTRIR